MFRDLRFSASRGRRAWWIKLFGGLVALTLVASACGSSDDDDDAGGGSGEDVNSSNAESSGDPVKGGTLVYGIDSDTANGWAPYRSSLATSGYIPIEAVTDSLFAVNADGEIVPNLAESVEHNDDYTTW